MPLDFESWLRENSYYHTWDIRERLRISGQSEGDIEAVIDDLHDDWLEYIRTYHEHREVTMELL